ncbi:MAG: T9SS type A sorting domain-containing protein [Chitinophagaceae bacterium]|nr:MAG: T9SS type A sorting domain-containing protein [Chitinophagaceae bacterium]
MQKLKILIAFLLVVGVASICYLLKNNSSVNKEEIKQSAYHLLRWKYDADMIKDPTTGEIPIGMREHEIEFAKTIPIRNLSNSVNRTASQNTYFPAGPNNIGGRTRALAYDVRFNGTTNRVIIAGSISGGIYRTTDGGANWTRVSPSNEIHNVATVVQDPRSGQQDTWFAGGGEYVGNSTEAIGAGYFAHGIFKSTDNGATWIRLPLNNITDINGAAIASGIAERFDHPFDYVHKLAINPVNGNLYVAGHRRLMRTVDGGTTFQTVFGSTTASFAVNGQSDVVISATGKVYLGYTGAAPDFSLRGVWKSTSGDQNSFTRLAGGSILGVDSVADWRGNAHTYQVVSGSNYYDTRRILLALAPSNENILYTLYQNGLSNASPSFSKEADLFKLDMTSGNTWTNLSANLPDFSGGNHEATDPFAIQGGYDLLIAVKPNDPNFVILGGTSLYRSTNGFSSAAGSSWIGGYGNTLPTLTFYANSHPDIHNIAFNPSNSNVAICSNDGGIQVTNDITASGSTVSWTNLNNYQTLQYYYVAIDPETGINNFVGGAQDNGTQFRDKSGIVGVPASDSNNHRRLVGGDGVAVGISKRNGSTQYLYAGIQLGSIRRGVLQSSFSTTDIRPTGLTPSYTGSTTEFGEFVTNFKLNPDNTEDLYYINFNRLFRTTAASTVSSSGWTELTGVSNAVNVSNGTNIAIRALAFSRGNYNSGHVLYIGTTDGKVFRLDDPRNTAILSAPVNISPSNTANLNIQDISVNPNNDNEIMLVVSNYGVTSGSSLNNVTNIWWTNNAKSASPTWRQAEGNLAGTISSGYISARSCMITVKKDASNNPVTEYYVGTSAGLFGVENLGTTVAGGGSPVWQREGSAEINFAVISSLSYRATDNVLLVGTHGNGIYYSFLGTPNFNPVTGIINPVLNDKKFIANVFPTAGSNLIQYKIGTQYEVKKILIQLLNINGQEIKREEKNYQDGVINLTKNAKGIYIICITSDNGKYKHVQKIMN